MHILCFYFVLQRFVLHSNIVTMREGPPTPITNWFEYRLASYAKLIRIVQGTGKWWVKIEGVRGNIELKQIYTLASVFCFCFALCLFLCLLLFLYVCLCFCLFVTHVPRKSAKIDQDLNSPLVNFPRAILLCAYKLYICRCFCFCLFCFGHFVTKKQGLGWGN